MNVGDLTVNAYGPPNNPVLEFGVVITVDDKTCPEKVTVFWARDAHIQEHWVDELQELLEEFSISNKKVC